MLQSVVDNLGGITPGLARPVPTGAPAADVADRVKALTDQISALSAKQSVLEQAAGIVQPESRWDIFSSYIGVFFVSFIIALIATPLMRRLAISNGIIDRPNEARKMHKLPVAYLGGVAVYLGIMAGIAFSYTADLHGLLKFHTIRPEHMLGGITVQPVPLSILVGLTVIMLIGLLDDVINVTPMQKIGGMLIASAALAMEDVGVKVAAQVLNGAGGLVGISNWVINLPLPMDLPLIGGVIHIDIIYWTGTAVIAIFVLGACNALNLIDGLDGLCSGITAIAGGALLVIALTLASYDEGRLDAARIVLCLAMLGACLGFLPHNYNPASIFLGDAGSLMLGYLTIVIVLTLGDTGRTNLVLCGLVIFAVPIMDTSLAIVRRKLAGQSISSADDNHLHHILKRMLGVKGAVSVLYLMGGAFGILGIALQATKSRVVYAIVLVIASFIGVIALKSARRKQMEEDALKLNRTPSPDSAATPAPAIAAVLPAAMASEPQPTKA